MGSATVGKAASEWVTLARAATAAAVSPSTLHRAARNGELPYGRLSGVRYFRLDDVNAWAARRAGSR